MQNLAHFAIKINSKLCAKSHWLFRVLVFKIPGGEYPRTSLHRSHLQRLYVLPPNFEFFIEQIIVLTGPSKPGNTDSLCLKILKN